MRILLSFCLLYTFSAHAQEEEKKPRDYTAEAERDARDDILHNRLHLYCGEEGHFPGVESIMERYTAPSYEKLSALRRAGEIKITSITAR